MNLNSSLENRIRAYEGGRGIRGKAKAKKGGPKSIIELVQGGHIRGYISGKLKGLRLAGGFVIEVSLFIGSIIETVLLEICVY
jgi:hypothetical protein